MLEKLLGLATLGSTFASVSLLHRFLAKLAIVIALTVVTALMVGVLIVGVFYGIYYGLTSYGLAPGASILLLGVFILLITTVLFGVTLGHIRQLRDLPPSTLNHTFASFTQIGTVAEAFLDGFLDRKCKKSQA